MSNTKQSITSKLMNKINFKKNKKQKMKLPADIPPIIFNSNIQSSKNNQNPSSQHRTQSQSTIPQKNDKFNPNANGRKILHAKRKSSTDNNPSAAASQNKHTTTNHNHSFGCVSSFTDGNSTKRKWDEPYSNLSKQCRFDTPPNSKKPVKNIAAKRMKELRRSLQLQIEQKNAKKSLSTNNVKPSSSGLGCTFKIPKKPDFQLSETIQKNITTTVGSVDTGEKNTEQSLVTSATTETSATRVPSDQFQFVKQPPSNFTFNVQTNVNLSFDAMSERNTLSEKTIVPNISEVDNKSHRSPLISNLSNRLIPEKHTHQIDGIGQNTSLEPQNRVPLTDSNVRTNFKPPWNIFCCSSKSNTETFAESPFANSALLEAYNRTRIDKTNKSDAFSNDQSIFTSPSQNITAESKPASANSFNQSIFSVSKKPATSIFGLETIGFASTSDQTLNESADSFDEKMEWEIIPEQKILEDIREVRKSVINTGVSNFDWHKSNVRVLHENHKSIFAVVVDTNIFISHISLIREMLEMKFGRRGTPTIIVPWMVLQELDFMKDGRHSGSRQVLQTSARNAVEFLNKCIVSKHPHIKGQTALEATKEVFKETIPDDGILNCCMQYCTNDNFVVLLSNDKNLRNKALVNNIPAYGTQDIIVKLKEETAGLVEEDDTEPDEKPKLIDLIKRMQEVLGKYFGMILEHEMKQAYKDVWQKIVFKKPPWSVSDTLQCFIKHWIAVFSFVFPKETRQTIEQLLSALKINLLALKQADLDRLVQSSMAVCLHLRRINKNYHALITECLDEIRALDSE